MRIIAISKRIITQLLRDSRTLALLLLAPLLIMTLLHFIFSSTQTQQLKVGVHHIPSALSSHLKESDVTIIKVDDKHVTDIAERHHLDAVIIGNQNIEIYYTNDTPSSTTALKQIIKSYEIKNKFKSTEVVIKEMQKQYSNIQAQLDKAKDRLGPLFKHLGIENNKVKQASDKEEKLITHYIYGDKHTDYFDQLNPIFIAFFVFFFTFLISGITLLKERTHGTLKKLLSTPIRRYEIVLGYIIGFSPFAIMQTTFIVLYSIYVLKFEVEGSICLFIMMNLLLAMTALVIGLFISTFATNEFQMIQFIPIIIVPQLLFSGIIPLDTMHPVLRVISMIMPLKYGADNLTRIMFKGQSIEYLYINIFVLIMFLVVFTLLNIVLLKKHRNI